MRVYLDNCCYNRLYDDQDQLAVFLETEAILFILDEIAIGRLDLAWSYMMDYENKNNSIAKHRGEIDDWRDFAVEIVRHDNIIEARQKHYMDLGLKSKDAVHLACAVEAGCACFLTTDKGILRKSREFPEIQIINPIAFACDLKG